MSHLTRQLRKENDARRKHAKLKQKAVPPAEQQRRAAERQATDRAAYPTAPHYHQ